jgi:predicted nucleic acid-binding protein
LIVAEVVSKIKRQKANAEVAYEAILSNSYVAEITPKTAKEAGLLHAELKNKIQGIGLADSLILCSSRALSAKIITEDAHFKSFKEAIVL